MRKTTLPLFVYSRPTMCLHCHLIVEMLHERNLAQLKDHPWFLQYQSSQLELC